MSDVKQVKVDNWGIYFLQRLKHFFNRTDYCDLTLQFQDNAQLKVHRLVLSACTEYFELLERTCEMYEDCLVMPDDLQADVVVPIVNFMYTGHLEFRMDLLERLYQTSQILNMPVLSKLLEAHRRTVSPPAHSYSAVKRYQKNISESKQVKPTASSKRSYSKAFENNKVVYRDKKVYQPLKTRETTTTKTISYRSSSPVPSEPAISNKRIRLGDPRPTRYELPEELDTDNVFDNSFCNISYECKPLMIHPETVKRYTPKRSGIFNEASSSKKILPGTSTVDIVECKRITKDDNIFDDNVPNHSINEDLDIFQASYSETSKDTNQLFDQMLDDGPKVTIETKDSKVASNLDHAKIISEVLKKYPHLVKSNKNIKLKILNTPNKSKKPQKVSAPAISPYIEEKPLALKTEEPDYTYETDVIDSQQAAKLIALGAENTKGPWICLICGTPGKALHFSSYFKFRRHLVEVHNEKPVANICEYCGLRSLKRNYLLHHLYSQHNVPPPPQYRFPKCDKCNYIALTEGFLIKHKLTHKKTKSFRCNVCSAKFSTTNELLQHIQTTGHKYSAERKTNLQCIYCLKTFLRHGNLYAHLKTNHEKEAKNDGILDDSDEEKTTVEVPRMKSDDTESKYHNIKFEPSTSYDIYNENIYEEVDVQYQIQENQDGDIQLTPTKQHVFLNQQHNSKPNTPKQKILNPGFGTPKPAQKAKPIRKPVHVERSTFLEDINIPSPAVVDTGINEEIVVIDNIEYIMRDNQLIPRKPKPGSTEFILSDMMDSASLEAVQPTTSMEYTNIHSTNIIQNAQPAMVVKKTSNLNQPIQIVVSNEEEYKALMSSNHPILFNNGDPNKTLTVLTAPHNATIESAAIDLDNTQSNDMMIIQEDFPLNVTEAVSTDNPNIVVVYSHPVDENKQFQILTTGGIGSQFVQSSAIITQNYETVTTTAPAMSAHVLESQSDTTWQDNGQSGNAEELTISQEIKPLLNPPTNNLNELPEVHLTPTLQTIVSQENTANGASNELNVINTEIISQTVIQEIAEVSHMPEPPMESVILGGDIIEQETSIAEPMDNSHNNDHIQEEVSSDLNPNLIVSNDLNLEPSVSSDINLEASVSSDINLEASVSSDINLETNISNDINLETNVRNDLNTETNASNNLNPNTNVQELVENENIIEQTAADVVVLLPQEEQATLETITENSVNVDTVTINQVAEITDNDDLRNTLDDEQPVQSQAYDEIVQISQAIVENPQTNSKTGEKIQNLTSEWSEDEYDVPEDAPKTLETVPNPVDVIRPADTEMLEETIENIQQEVLNHVSTTTALTTTTETAGEAEIEEGDNSALEDTVSCLEEPQLDTASDIIVAPVINASQAQENISSLLNDWEDNDSPEEKNSEEPVVGNKEETAEPTTENIPKPDIKSLVSDWDDDDEENKEQ